VNFIDTYHRSGLYPAPLPFTPGIEAAGKIESCSPGVSGFEKGERVVYCMSLGAYAEYSVVDAWKVVPLPEGVEPEAGVTAMCQGMTAHYLVNDCYNLLPNQTALVHAAAGGVGLLLVQMARQKGAVVIGTVSTPAKAELARKAGARHVILYTEEDFEARVRELTDGGGVHVVYESVGKSTFEKSLNCLRRRGYMVLYGQSSGPVAPFDPQVLSQKGSLFLTRPSLFDYTATPQEFAERASAVLDQVRKRELKVRIGEKFPLSEASKAHQKLEERLTTGKVLLEA